MFRFLNIVSSLSFFIKLALLCSMGASFALAQFEDSRLGQIRAELQQLDRGDIKSPNRWPKEVDVPRNTRLREVSQRQSKMEGFTYATQNYIFNSPVALEDKAQESIGRLFECTFAANQAIAKILPIMRSKRARTSSNRFKVKLFIDMDAYHAAGGSEGSAGVFRYQYQPSKRMSEDSIIEDYVMVPFPSLGVSADGKLENDHVDSHVLVHESTHQCTCLNQLPVWANEGLSEYVAYIPYDGDKLEFEEGFVYILGNAKLRTSLDFPFSLEEFFEMEKEDMYDLMKNKVDTYMLSALCVAYFVHLETRSGVRNFQEYLKDLYAGKDNKDALKSLYGRLPRDKSMQDLFIEAWAKWGLTIKFAEKTQGFQTN